MLLGAIALYAADIALPLLTLLPVVLMGRSWGPSGRCSEGYRETNRR